MRAPCQRWHRSPAATAGRCSAWTADLLRDDADALDALSEHALAAASHDDGLDVRALAQLSAAVRRRVLRRAATAAGAPAGSLAAVHVDALDALVIRWPGQGAVDLPGGVAGRRAYDRLSFLPRMPPGAA